VVIRRAVQEPPGLGSVARLTGSSSNVYRSSGSTLWTSASRSIPA